MPKQEKIRTLFNGIAPDYDKLNHILSLDIDRIWRKTAVKEAVGDNCNRLKILDIATGTGDFAIELAKKTSPDSRITGLDISEEMLRIGKEKSGKNGLEGKISFIEAPVENLPFKNNDFDRITCAFGVRNFEDREKGLKEMFRVLSPGGKMVILELSTPKNRCLKFLYDIYFKRIMPGIGGLVSGDRQAYEYLQASVHAFPPPEEFCRTISGCGFCEVRAKSLSFGICRMFTAIKR